MSEPSFQCALEAGIRLFNAQAFFEAHEAWEEQWHHEQGPTKKFLQGLIQAAVAFHKLQTGNPRGLRKMLTKAVRNLQPFSPANYGVELEQFLEQLRHWNERAQEMERMGETRYDSKTLPRIERV